MAVVLSFRKDTIFIWRIWKFAHEIFSQNIAKIFGYIFNAKISELDN